MDSALLDRIRSHISEVRVPSKYDKVYKDECMYCFASPESTDGIFVNMKNWHGVGARFLDLDHKRTGVSLYYNEEHQRVPLPEEAVEAQEAAPTKMAIGGDQGFQVNKKRYEIAKICRLLIMPDKTVVQIPCPELPELLLQAIAGIQGNEGSNIQEQASTWEEERRESKYARGLEQLPPERKISPIPSDWECEFTGVKENLWLNLSTGKIGSGRRHWDGSGGNGAALKHFEQTGSKYPLVVKLGTITPHSADVYSYAPDEDDMVTDPLLKEHLAHWGINMMQMEKTDKTMAELQIDMNIKFEYNAITEGGSELKPVMGPGKVGITNLGNYCYMSSILQALWAIPAFGRTFTGPDRSNVLEVAPADLANDFPAQFAKVGSAIVSGETDRLPYMPKGATEQVQLEANIEANSIPPRRFKALVGKGHPEFSTGHQQDACEFFIHLMQLLERAEHKSGDRMRASEEAPPLSSIFKFKLEQRTQCAATGAVSYKDEEQNVLHVDIPLEAATNCQEVAEHAVREQKRKEMKEQQAQAYIGAVGGDSVVAEEVEEPVVPIVPFDACLEKFAAEATLTDYYSPALGAKGRATVTHRLASFPPYLMVHLQKYFVDETWRPRKMEVLTDMQHTINLERLRAQGPQPDERLQPKDPEAPAEAAGAPKGPVPDAGIVSSLTAAGFAENACKRAAVAVGNSDADAAMNWLLSHMEDADINEPLPSVDAHAGAPARGAVDPESVGMLSAMGFTERQAQAALKSCNGSVERAADWLFTRTDDLDAAVAAVESETAAPAASAPSVPKEMLDGPGKYELVAIVSHIGSNIACGHYVAHVKKDGLWYIFNDEKVALSEKLPIGHGYMYLYRRTDQPWS